MGPLQRYSLYLILVFFFSSCVKEEGVQCSDQADRGAIQLFPDWTERGTDINIPEYFNAHLISGQDRKSYIFPRITLQNNILAGLESTGYTLYTYNDAENITVSANVVTVTARPTGTERVLLEQPGYLFTCVDKVIVPVNDTLPVYPRMVQQVRKLTITFDVRAPFPVIFSQFNGMLNGTAGSLDLDTDTAGSPSSVDMIFSQTGTEVSVTLYLLGIVSSVDQTITLNFTYNNGISGSVTVNLSSLLRNFNIGKRIPMELRALLNLDESAVVTASITDWEDRTEYIKPI